MSSRGSSDAVRPNFSFICSKGNWKKLVVRKFYKNGVDVIQGKNNL